MEPPGAGLPGGPAAGLTAEQLRLAAVAGAAALVVGSTGDAFLLAVLLGVAAADVVAGAAAIGVALALLARWGSSSLAAVAGAQAVLGPAVALGPVVSGASVWLATLALVVVAPAGWRAVLFGATAGLVACGPAATSWANAGWRLLGLVVGAGLVYLAAPRLARTPVRWVGPPLAFAAVALAVAA